MMNDSYKEAHEKLFDGLEVVIDYLNRQMEAQPNRALADTTNYLIELQEKLKG